MNFLRNTFAVIIGLAVAALIITLGIRLNSSWITYEDFTNDVIDSITTTIVDNGKSNAEPSRADQVNAMCDMLFKKYEEYKKVEHTGGDREVLVDNIELSDEAQLRESERANEAC